jgi:hypothetical protein
MNIFDSEPDNYKVYTYRTLDDEEAYLPIEKGDVPNLLLDALECKSQQSTCSTDANDNSHHHG